MDGKGGRGRDARRIDPSPLLVADEAGEVLEDADDDAAAELAAGNEVVEGRGGASIPW